MPGDKDFGEVPVIQKMVHEEIETEEKKEENIDIDKMVEIINSIKKDGYSAYDVYELERLVGKLKKKVIEKPE